MSLRHFLVTTNKIIGQKQFLYKDIIQGIKPTDMLYNGKICFTNILNDAELEAARNAFQQMHIYAIRSDFTLCYRTDFAQTLSESAALNALGELLWLKSYIASMLSGQNIVMIVPLYVGSANNYSRFKTKICNINEWELNRENNFEFEHGIIYQFTDGSKGTKPAKNK
jgi:hypothetical protein